MADALELMAKFGPILKAGFPEAHSVTRFQVAETLAAQALAFAQQAPDGWEPIDTAPKDGRLFLAYARQESGKQDLLDNEWILVACYDSGGMRHKPVFKIATFMGTPHFVAKLVTHWRPLPAPPAMLDASPSVGEGV